MASSKVSFTTEAQHRYLYNLTKFSFIVQYIIDRQIDRSRDQSCAQPKLMKENMFAASREVKPTRSNNINDYAEHADQHSTCNLYYCRDGLKYIGCNMAPPRTKSQIHPRTMRDQSRPTDPLQLMMGTTMTATLRTVTEVMYGALHLITATFVQTLWHTQILMYGLSAQ